MNDFNFDDYAKEQDESRRKALTEPYVIVPESSADSDWNCLYPNKVVPYERYQELEERFATLEGHFRELNESYSLALDQRDSYRNEIDTLEEKCNRWVKQFTDLNADWSKQKEKIRTLEEQLENSSKSIPVDWRTSGESGPELNTLMLGFLGLSVPELCQKDWTASTQVSEAYEDKLNRQLKTFKMEYMAEWKEWRKSE